MARAEEIVDLAPDRRQVAALEYQNTENSRVEEEIVEQSIRALDTKELRVSVSQSDPKTLDEAVDVALRLKSIHLAENQNSAKINMPEMVGNHGNETAGAKTRRAPKLARVGTKETQIRPVTKTILGASKHIDLRDIDC